MKPTVYIETTIISYLTARLSRELVTAAHQQITQDWWSERRAQFELLTSELVIQEAARGNESMARRRLEELQSIRLVEIDADAEDLARRLVESGPMPQKANVDALHIAVATVHGVEYLLTWNCKHIANAETRGRIVALCRASGYEPPVICTPGELLGE